MNVKSKLLVGILCGVTMAVTFVGCGEHHTDIVIEKDQSKDGPVRYNDFAWATVLRENVTDDLVRYDHLTGHRQPLDDYLSMVADAGPETTPESFPTRNEKTCYYVNVYNALMLKAVLLSDAPQSMHGHDIGVPDHRFRTIIDGRKRTLAEVRTLAWDAAGGDARVLLALCDAAIGSPAIQGTPLRPTGLEDQLRRIAQRAMDNHAMVTIDHVEQWLMVSPVILDRRSDFIDYYRQRTGAASATLHDVVAYLASTVRRQWLNTAVGYSVHRIPFDRRLNDWGRSKNAP